MKTKPKRIRDRSSLTEAQKELLKENIGKLSIDELSEILGVKRRSLFLILRNKYNTEDYWNLYDINPSLFVNPNSPEVAYILGFIWGDGTVKKDNHGIVVDISYIDSEVIKNTFFSVGKWSYTTSFRDKKQKSGIFSTYNSVIGKFLGENDYYDKSSKSPYKILKLIPEENRHLFFRGWFDSDGCISGKGNKYFSVFFSGSFNQDWLSLIELSKNLNFKYSIYKKTNSSGSSSSFSINTQGQKIFLNYIYQSREQDLIGLDRKFERYTNFLKSFDNKFKSKTGFLGVFPCGIKYCAKIHWNNKKEGKGFEHLGVFDDLLSAAKAYDKAIIMRKGLNAKTNFPILNI